jgi:hypothetical protein
MPAWKHSQYFLRQPLFLQLHPLAWRGPAAAAAASSIFARKALGLRSRTASTAAWRSRSCAELLQQERQLQPSQ